VNDRNAAWLLERVRPGDIIAVHDPQPMPLARSIAEKVAVDCVWRCHIGVDETNDRTRDAWQFLRPYADAYQTAIFTAPEYIPDYFANRAAVIHPALDPLTCKNREISVHKIASVMANSALSVNPGPVLSAPFTDVAERLLPNGRFAPANMTEDIGLIHRPIVAQISRWDRLKGFAPLMEAFARIKTRLWRNHVTDPVHHRRLELVRMVLAGPRPGTIADDPEGVEVLEDLVERYCKLDPMTQRDLAIVTLPMESVDENALMTNAIQRTSSIVVQNSIREGFGLTVTEAMWKGIPVLSNRRAVGPRLQVRDGIDGCLIDDPTDPEALADVLRTMLAASGDRDRWGRSARRHAHQEFLIFTQLERWIQLLVELVRKRSA
jgi:trehalose synthase